MQIHFTHQDLFFLARALGDHPSKRIAKKRSSPEFEARSGGGFPANISGFKADSIDHRHVDPVGDGVSPLDGAPGVVLPLAELRLLRRMPSNRGGIKEHMRPLQGGQAGAFRIPLIPAYECAHTAHLGVKSAKAQVAGREVVLLVVQRIIRNVHLAVEAEQGTIGIKNRGRVVIDARGAPLEQGGDQHDVQLPRQSRESGGRRTRNWLG